MLRLIWKKFELSHGKLSEQFAWRLWLSTSFSILIATAIAYDVLDGDISEKSLNLIKVGLLLLAFFSFSLSLLINNHRTVQTKHQIAITEVKNRTDLYLAHYKYNSELSSPIKRKLHTANFNGDILIEVAYPSILYRNLYSGNNIQVGVVDIIPDREEKKLVRFLSSMYANHFRGVSTQSNEKEDGFISVYELPVDFMEDELIGKNLKRKMRITLIFKELQFFLHNHGIRIVANDKDHNEVVDYRNAVLSDDMWIITLSAMLTFWFEVNRCLASDLDESKIRYASSSFAAFLRKITELA